ncbi:unnamed protein product [Laminaria digitata]
MTPVEDEEEDPFWTVQLVNDNEACRPFTSEARRSDYQDHALPVGTAVTDTSLAGVFGREREVYVPVTSTIIGANAGDDDRDSSSSSGDNRNSNSGSNTNTNTNCGLSSSNNSNSSKNSSSGGSSRAWLGQSLVLKLRQVNGDGVMSGVGGDVWCAALLLSTWLLENPEVVQGLDVLELGSGLGLCGITAGYLAKSVTLTDYIDELLVNLRHNIEVNRTPRVASTLAPGKPYTGIEPRGWSRSGHGEDAGEGPATATVPQRRLEYTAVMGDSVVVASGNDLSPLPPPPPLQRTPLLPLARARVRVRKLDWTAFAGDGEARRASSGEADVGGGWWWDDRGPDAHQSGTMAPARSQLSESDSLHCDVAVGSALVYSPHHACVADVLSHLFVEEGGCRAAYVVQLSTRPGFDDFLHRLGACGLRYRLERIPTVLPAAILNEIRRSARGAVTGGPVTRTTDPAAAPGDEGGDDDDGDDRRQDCGNDIGGGDGMGGQEEASDFDEFVLCSVFRPRDSTSR